MSATDDATEPQSHPHMKHRDMAEANTILRVQVGSGVHGTAISGQDDRDEMGVCLELPRYVTGLDRFEQYEYHTAWDRPGGVANRSGAGDLDVVIYSARKWARLALAGNPTVLLLLFTTPSETVVATSLGVDLRGNAHRFASKQAGQRFLGYMRAQREGMLGLRSRDVNRPELVAKYGYDTKYAMHMLRLGAQGVEFMRTGRIELPIPEPTLGYLRDVRQGVFSRDRVIADSETVEALLRNAIENSHLPDVADYEWAHGWLHQAYTRWWRPTDTAVITSL